MKNRFEEQKLELQRLKDCVELAPEQTEFGKPTEPGKQNYKADGVNALNILRPSTPMLQSGSSVSANKMESIPPALKLNSLRHGN